MRAPGSTTLSLSISSILLLGLVRLIAIPLIPALGVEGIWQHALIFVWPAAGRKCTQGTRGGVDLISACARNPQQKPGDGPPSTRPALSLRKATIPPAGTQTDPLFTMQSFRARH